MSNKIGLFYSFNSGKTKKVAERLKKNLQGFEIEDVNIETADGDSLDPYEKLIFGSSTWFDGELPNYWDEFLPAIEEKNFSGKKLAIFGLGDQKNYPENFCDAIGILADFFENRGMTIVGRYPSEGFDFESSRALRDHEFIGLPLDEENLSGTTNQRIQQWSEQLKQEFS